MGTYICNKNIKTWAERIHNDFSLIVAARKRGKGMDQMRALLKQFCINFFLKKKGDRYGKLTNYFLYVKCIMNNLKEKNFNYFISLKN